MNQEIFHLKKNTAMPFVPVFVVKACHRQAEN